MYGGKLSRYIIQRTFTLPKYGHGALNIRRPYTTDILRYRYSNFLCRRVKWQNKDLPQLFCNKTVLCYQSVVS